MHGLGRSLAWAVHVVIVSALALGMTGQPPWMERTDPVLDIQPRALDESDHTVYLPLVWKSAGGDEESYVFAVVGDYGSGSADEAAVAALVDGWNPALVITTGDNNYDTGSAETIDDHIGQFYQAYIGNYQGEYGLGGADNRFFPSLGNHDWVASGAQPYLDYFTLPGNERYYSFSWGPVTFYAIDSDPNEPDGVSADSEQAAWLQNTLSASTACWNLVYFHHAAYSSGPHGSTIGMQWPFESWGADAVLAGHDHVYERLLVGGIPYFVDGVGGKSLYTFGDLLPESQAHYNAAFGAMRVAATSSSLTYELVDVGGEIQDRVVQLGGCQ